MNYIPAETGKRRGSVFPYAVGIGLLLLAAINAVIGSAWYLGVGLAACGLVVILAFRKHLFHNAIRRISADEVLCGFVPWYHASSIALAVLVPIIGIVLIAAGRAPDSPALLRYAGYFALLLGIAFALFAVVQSTNRLSFTRSKLLVRMGRRFEIPRERFVAIKTRELNSVGTGRTSQHYDLVYAAPDGGSNKILAAVDMQFSVEPANLASALQAWKDADPIDPGLIDHLESILRGQTAAGH